MLLYTKKCVVPGVVDSHVFQVPNAPSLTVDVDRALASQIGATQQEAANNVLVATNSSAQSAPNFWIDPRNNNTDFLNVQYPEGQIQNISDLKGIPLRGPRLLRPTRLDMVADVSKILAPTEVDHYQLRRTIDVFIAPKAENIGTVAPEVQKIVDQVTKPEGIRVKLRGTVQAMYASFSSFGFGLLLSVLLVYLVRRLLG